ncbi:hypothetical protein ABK046_47630, partial [Streptomyces caeruleatus]
LQPEGEMLYVKPLTNHDQGLGTALKNPLPGGAGTVNSSGKENVIFVTAIQFVAGKIGVNSMRYGAKCSPSMENVAIGFVTVGGVKAA